MRVMSWNLWWRFGDDWRQRQHGITAMLQDLRPDVAGLQEVWSDKTTSQAELLAKQLGMHSAFAAPSLPPVPAPPESPDQEGVDLGVAILSRWPIRGLQQHLLPAVHRHQPVVFVATLDHPAGPLRVAVS
jgi:endonuclease/exonuclease/phosphatase family metal-dependent hydrolase